MSEIAASDIVETVPSALITLDRNLIITSANRAFYQTFRTNRSETEGCMIWTRKKCNCCVPTGRAATRPSPPR